MTSVLIFDTETSCLVKKKRTSIDELQPDLVQLGFILVDVPSTYNDDEEWRLLQKGSLIVKRPKHADPTGETKKNKKTKRIKEMEQKAENTHGISNETARQYGITLELVLKLFEEIVNVADIIVGHNLQFDVTVMDTAYYRSQLSHGSDASGSSFTDLISQKQHVCTMAACANLFPKKSLYDSYRKITNGRGKLFKNRTYHDALIDAEATFIILKYLVKTGKVNLTRNGDGNGNLHKGNDNIYDKVPLSTTTTATATATATTTTTTTTKKQNTALVTPRKTTHNREKSKRYTSNVTKKEEKKRPLLKVASMIDRRTKRGKEAVEAKAKFSPRELASKAALARFNRGKERDGI